MAQRGLIWEREGVSLLRLQKPHTGPHKRDNGGPSGFAAYRSSGFLLFLGLFPKSFSLFMRRSFCTSRSSPSLHLIMFHRTLLWGMKTFCFSSRLRNRMRFPQAASKLVQIGVAMSLGIVSLPRPGKPHTSPHSRSRRAFLLSFRTRCFFPLHIQGCFL